MVDDQHVLKDKLKAFFKSMKFAVLSTSADGQPYASLVAFVEDPDLAWIVFATERSTRKFKNLTENRKIALLIENSTNSETDIDNAMAVTITGNAEITEVKEKERLSHAYLSKHPYLKTFVTSPSCAFIKVNVDQYVLVEKFQKVNTFKML